jgi:hypothetical protein
MNQLGSFKLRKVAGGTSHYAYVRLSIEQPEARGKIDFSRLRGVPESWIVAAQDGVEHALRRLGNSPMASAPVRLEACEGTPADTDVDSIWCAAVLACLSMVAPGMVAAPAFDLVTRRWHVVLDGLTRLVPPQRVLDLAAHVRNVDDPGQT